MCIYLLLFPVIGDYCKCTVGLGQGLEVRGERGGTGPVVLAAAAPEPISEPRCSVLVRDSCQRDRVNCRKERTAQTTIQWKSSQDSSQCCRTRIDSDSERKKKNELGYCCEMGNILEMDKPWGMWAGEWSSGAHFQPDCAESMLACFGVVSQCSLKLWNSTKCLHQKFICRVESSQAVCWGLLNVKPFSENALMRE